MQPIETSRLHLRPLARHDESFYCDLFTDADLMRDIGNPLALGTASAAFQTSLAMMREAMPRAWLWRAEESATGEVVGLVGIVMRKGMPEIGSIIVAPQQGRGYAYESLAAVRDAGFQVFGLPSLFGQQQPGNQRSIGLMNKLGFRQIPAPPDRIHWRMDKEEWTGRLI